MQNRSSQRCAPPDPSDTRSPAARSSRASKKAQFLFSDSAKAVRHSPWHDPSGYPLVSAASATLFERVIECYATAFGFGCRRGYFSARRRSRHCTSGCVHCPPAPPRILTLFIVATCNQAKSVPTHSCYKSKFLHAVHPPEPSHRIVTERPSLLDAV